MYVQNLPVMKNMEQMIRHFIHSQLCIFHSLYCTGCGNAAAVVLSLNKKVLTTERVFFCIER